LKFLLDAHMPRALEAGIRAAGHECDGARRLIGADASDVEIAKVANQLGAAVLSKDVDFVDLVHRRVLRMPLIRVCLPNMKARETCDAILPLLPTIVASIAEGQTIIEIR
jgi:predicted nuclease of predicted toxin-antitoxin system